MMSVRESTAEPPVLSGAAGAHWADFLLSHGSAGDAGAGRAGGTEWRPISCRSEWKLSWQAPGEGWRGYPVLEIEEAGWRLWLLGEIYGGSNARERALAVASGLDSPIALNGHWLLLGWDDSERQWHVWTDRFGTVHAYLATDGTRPSLGTFFPAVARAASRRKLDWEALAGFFAFGFFPRDRTFFEGVRIVRPASHCVFDHAGKLLVSERYWRWRHRPDPARSYEDTVTEFAGVLHTVMHEEARGRLAVPISGGLDSRTTVAVLTESGREARTPLWSYSYGYTADSVETRIAGRVAAARRLPFRALTVGPYLFEKLERVLACVEGFQDLTQTRQAVVANLLAREADAVVAAHWGDVWLDDMGLIGSARPDGAGIIDHALAKIRKAGAGWLLENVVRPSWKQAPEPMLREVVAEELARVEDIDDPDFRVKAFKTEQWSFRWTLASVRMFQAGAFPRLPFYDTRMTDFFATVPSRFVQGRRLQIDYLKRNAPDLARIPWQAYGTNLYRLRHFHTWLLPARAVKKAMRALSPRDAPQRNWEVQFLSPEGRGELERHLLSRGRRLHDLVDPARLRALLDDFFDAPLESGRGYTVSMLLTFSSWLEAHG